MPLLHRIGMSISNFVHGLPIASAKVYRTIPAEQKIKIVTAVTSATVAGVAGGTVSSMMEQAKKNATTRDEVTRFLEEKGSTITSAVDSVTTKLLEASKHAEKAENAAIQASKSEAASAVISQDTAHIRDEARELVIRCQDRITSHDIAHKKYTEQALQDIQGRLGDYTRQMPEAHASASKSDIVMRSVYEYFGTEAVERYDVILFTVCVASLFGFILAIGLIFLITSGMKVESISVDQLRRLSKLILIQALRSSVAAFIIGWGSSLLCPIISLETGVGSVASILISALLLSLVSLLVYVVFKKVFRNEK